MSYIAHGPKKPVNMTLSEDLVRQACALTGNLSQTVEHLLAEFVTAERGRRNDKERLIAATIAMLNDCMIGTADLARSSRRSDGAVRRSRQYRPEPG
jgi:antitoxin CcdA